MDSDDAFESTSARWLYVGTRLIVSAGVFWCWWTCWQEGTPATVRVASPHGEPEPFVYVTILDPRFMHVLPAIAASGALVAGLFSGAGRESRRHLALAAIMTGMKAVTVGIEWLLRK